MFKSCFGKKKNIERTINLNINSNNEITNLNSLSNKLIYTNLKKKYIEELENLHHAISNMKTTYLYQSLKKNNLELDYKKNNFKDMTCQICFDKSVNRIIIPCGHLVCDTCISNKYECFFCRKLIDNTQNIYFT